MVRKNSEDVQNFQTVVLVSEFTIMLGLNQLLIKFYTSHCIFWLIYTFKIFNPEKIGVNKFRFIEIVIDSQEL